MGGNIELCSKRNNQTISNTVCIQHPKILNRSIYATESPVDGADHAERDKEYEEAISECISQIFKMQKKLSERELEHERQIRMLELALAERSDQLEEEKEGREARNKEELGLNDYKTMMESKLLAADTRVLEAEGKLRKQTERDASEEADRQRRPSPLERLSLLRKEKKREGQGAKFNSDKLSEKILALTVEVVLTRAEMAMILGKWLALREYGKYASELAAELDFEPLSERCKFFEDISQRQTSDATPKV